MDYKKRALEVHEQEQGVMETVSKLPLETVEDLSVAYTPGVAEVCMAIAKDPNARRTHTLAGRTVAVVTDGSAVLGLGDIGPAASLPVMEGKAALFKHFGGVDAFPVALSTQDVDEVVETVKRLAVNFAGVNLEDIAAPRCFEIEKRLKEELDIPVMHDDQHGTAVVILAGLLNALKVVKKDLSAIRVVMSGAGAAGIATAHMLAHAGVENIVMVDSRGALVAGRDGMNPYKEGVVRYNVANATGELADVLVGADVFIGVSAPGILTKEMVGTMASDAIIFALANPVPEIEPALAHEAGAAVVATGRSDHPNQVNNVLAFPGLFKGAIEAGASDITRDMQVAAAHAIAASVESPSPECIIPSPFTSGLADRVAESVKNAI